MKKQLRQLLIVLSVLIGQPGFAQPPVGYKSWNPASATTPVIEGQAWPDQVRSRYDRLPASAEGVVRSEVWDLSRQSAGLCIRFHSNSKDIIVRYGVGGGIQMPHMPATGVSGVDLYSKTIDGQWLWCGGKYSFGDTVQYRFNNLDSNDQHVKDREYTLYLPLYNSVKWMEILVPSANTLDPIPVRRDLPIVVYGTSIAQGGVASRPGLAWPAWLGREIERPVINLGFSGNGRLEREVLDMIAGIDARVYVLDCLPNLVSSTYSSDELKKRLANAVSLLQSRHPQTPILLVDHAGYTNAGTNTVTAKDFLRANLASKAVFDSLTAAGVKNIYRLTREEIGLDIESTVDAVHPNDIGMMRYADAYAKKIKTILNEPEGRLSTCIPVTQRRDAASYDWETRHYAVMAFNKAHAPETIFLGNSITHYWGGEPASSRTNGPDSWKKYFGALHAVNMGFGWDRVENVLWRIYHGELDSIRPKQMVMMIGTNNLQLNTDQEIIDGLRFLVKAIQARQPSLHILLLGIFPRRDMEKRVAVFNKQLSATKFNTNVHYADAGKLFLKSDQKLDESLFSDGLHPNEQGYSRLGEFIRSRLIW